MATPTVAVAPAGPWAHTQEDATVEVFRPIKSIGRAGVRSIVVIAVRTNGWNADVDDDLRLSRWRQGQARQQCCCSEKNIESSHMRPPFEVSVCYLCFVGCSVAFKNSLPTANTIRGSLGSRRPES
jgi:hypothetical protein